MVIELQEPVLNEELYCLDINEDLYFLDAETAYRQASKQHLITDNKQNQRLQYCYYDGPLTDVVLENFIQISSDNFVEKLANSELPIPAKIVVQDAGATYLNEVPVDVIEEIESKRREWSDIVNVINRYGSIKKLSDFLGRDTYYLDPLLALNDAKFKNRVYIGHPTIDGLQVCFYRGTLPVNRIKNLVNVELEHFIEFFIETTFRIPQRIDISVNLPDEQKQEFIDNIESLIQHVKKQRFAITRQLLEKTRVLNPIIDPERPLRIFIPSSRLTTVMQYCSLNVAKEFKKRGFEVLFNIEANDMCGFNSVDQFRQYLAFNPHIIFYVNDSKNFIQSPAVVNISWWQDLMPALKAGKPLQWRENDFVFSYTRVLDEHLANCGVKQIVRQSFAVDDDIFNTNISSIRDEKVVFIGSSYLPWVNLHNPEDQRVLEILLEKLNNGAVLAKSDIARIAEQTELSEDYIFWKLLHYVIRDHTVKWLCRQTALPVEIYGRYWNQDVDLTKFYAGELAHGDAVADVYRGAKYALVCHPFEINSQRLAEVIACGCIPIVYDCRAVAETPHWDDYCLFFKTAEDLQHILETRALPARSPLEIANQFSYRLAVDNFIAHSGIKGLMEAHSHAAAASRAQSPGEDDLPAADIYFLSFDLALTQAHKQRLITEPSGERRLQYCYYDGELSGCTEKNIIRVAQHEFTEFFVNNDLPIPCWVVNERGEGVDLSVNSGVINEIQQLRNNRIEPLTHPDTDFFDALEALNTAKQQNIHLDRDGRRGQQICYYHGDIIETDLDNLIHVDLNQIVDFFVGTRLRLPEQLRADPALRDDYENVFSAIAEHKREITELLKQQARELSPGFRPLQSARILVLAANAESELFYLAEQLRHEGFICEVYLENSTMTQFNSVDFLSKYIEYQPDILIQENHLYNDYLHKDIINVVYWFGNIQGLEAESELIFRNNDFNVTFFDVMEMHLRRCSARNVFRARDFSAEQCLFGLYSPFSEKQNYLIEKIVDYPVFLKSFDREILDLSRDTFLGNIQGLKECQPAIYQQVQAFFASNSIQVMLGHQIGTTFFSVSVAINDVEVFKLNPKQLQNNRKLLADYSQKYLGQDFYAYCLAGIGLGYELLEILSSTDMPIKALPNVEIPIYVVENNVGLLVAAMAVNSLQPVFLAKRVRFYLGGAALVQFESGLQDLNVVVPELFIDAGASNNLADQVQDVVKSVNQKRKSKYIKNLQDIDAYYAEITPEQWREKYSESNRHNLRVLALTSLFTSFLQYCIRDLIDGFSRLGVETFICTEEENYQRVGMEKLIADIADFKPDMVVVIDHFRHEYPGIPASVPFVNWIQDMLPNITGNKQTMKAKDFTFVFVKNRLRLNELPIYKDSPIELLPLGYNDKIYFPINERKNYECDVLVVTHLQEPERTFAPIRNPEEFHFLLNGHEAKIIDAGLVSKAELIELYLILDKHISSLNISEFNKFCTMRGANSMHDSNFLTVDEFNAIFYKKNITLEPQIMEVLYPLTGNRLHCEYLSKMKTWPVSSLIDSCSEIGIHLYGRNWNRYQKFKKFVRGVADNGEYLNRIMNNAKICLSVSPGITLHMRAIEIIAAGSFMLSRKNEYDKSPLTDYFSEEEVVLYDDEDDFIKKVGFYLENEYERNRIAHNALTKAQEIFSYKAIAGHMLSSINTRLLK